MARVKMADDKKKKNKLLQKARVSVSPEAVQTTEDIVAGKDVIGMNEGKAPMSSMVPEDNKKIIQASAPVLAETVNQAEGLNAKEKKQVIANISNPKKMDKIATKEKPSSVSDQFTQALTFFAPQILGGLGGALFEGTEGALAGMEAGGEARDAFISYQQKEDQLRQNRDKIAQSGLPKQKPFQQARDSFIEDANGNLVPALMDVNTGDLINPITKQKVTSADKIHTGEERRSDVFDFDKSKAAQLSGTQVDSIKGFNTTMEAMNRVAELKKGVETGPFAGRAQGVGATFGMADDNFVAIRTEVENAKADFLKAMSGAQVSEQEAKRLSNIIPNVNDDDNIFNTKLATFNGILARHKEQIMAAIQSGQPLRKETIEAMKKEAGIKDTEQKNKSAAEIIANRSQKENSDRLKMLREKYKGRR